MGQGRLFFVWLLEKYGAHFTILLERADGGRQATILLRPMRVVSQTVSHVFAQDLDYDAAVPLFVNRKYFVEFLHERVFVKKHSDILDDFLYVTFTSVQYIAMTRADALVGF